MFSGVGDEMSGDICIIHRSQEVKIFGKSGKFVSCEVCRSEWEGEEARYIRSLGLGYYFEDMGNLKEQTPCKPVKRVDFSM